MTSSSNSPQHIAIIMDGNGRWANARHRTRIMGHIKGARVAKKVIEHASRLKIKALTLYTFSEENWGRPLEEVNFLMRLLARHIVRERKSLIRNNIRFRCIGHLEKLPQFVRDEVEETSRVTKENTGLVLTFALSYGGRQELTQTVKNIARLVQESKLKIDDIGEDLISGMLQTAPIPDPDLLIRTSGEWRLSNFLPWQSIYTELYFSNTLWPDFTTQHLDAAIQSYSNRDRRFGKIDRVDKSPPTLNS